MPESGSDAKSPWNASHPAARGGYTGAMRCAVLVPALLLVAACGPQSDKKPAGTIADPVDICEEVGQVCRIDKARLGVCVEHGSGEGFACQPQH